MAAKAVHPFAHEGKASPLTEENQFVQMRDGQEPSYEYDEVEALEMEKRGRRLRRAALTAGILSVFSILCLIYSTVAIRWVIVDWSNPEKTAYKISDSIRAFQVGIFCDTLLVVLETFVGVLIGLILIGAGVNPAMSVLTVVFKIMQQAVMGANIIHLFVASILLDKNIALNSVIKTYFFSDYAGTMGSNMAYLFLVINKYGNIFAQGEQR